MPATPRTAAKVQHFVYADDPRWLVPAHDATIENWHAGRILPAYDPDHPPTCELSRRPIDHPIVAYARAGQQSMDDIQMYSEFMWAPKLNGGAQMDPQRGYRLRARSAVLECQPLPFPPPPPPGFMQPTTNTPAPAPPRQDSIYEDCLTKLTQQILADSVESPVSLRRHVKQSLRWVQIRRLLGTVPLTSDTLLPEILAFEDMYRLFDLRDPELIKRMHVNILKSAIFFHLERVGVLPTAQPTTRYRYTITHEDRSVYVIHVNVRPHQPYPNGPVVMQHWMEMYRLPTGQTGPFKNKIPAPAPPPSLGKRRHSSSGRRPADALLTAD